MKTKILSFLALIVLYNNYARAQCSLTNPDGTFINYQCPDDILYLNATIPYAGIYAKGRAFTKFRSGNNGQYRKPMILVEGLDLNLGNNNDQGHRIGDRGWPNFITGIANERDASDHILTKLPSLINDLSSKGFDMIYLDFEDGSGLTQANAMVLVHLIQYLNANKIGNEQIAVVGASMGGQVAKYALSYMEANNIKHCVNEYISLDSPHRGANIPLGLQAFVNDFANLHPLINSLKQKLNAPASKQLLLNCYNTPGHGEDPLRTIWLSDLNSVGNFPKKTRNVAIANGSIDNIELFPAGNKFMQFELENGLVVPTCSDLVPLYLNVWSVNNGTLYSGKYPKGANMVEMTANLGLCNAACIQCATNPGLFFENNYFYNNNFLKYDNAPGAKKNTIESFGKEITKALQSLAGDLGLAYGNAFLNVHQKDHTFIPTFSALDINTTNLNFNIKSAVPDLNKPFASLHPFESIYGPEGINETHVEFTDANNTWVIDEMAKIENKLTYVNALLNSSSPNNGTFNYARNENRLLRTLTIENGGKLLVNNNTRSDFGVNTPGPVPYNLPAANYYSIPTPGSTYTLETCYCDNVVVKVGNNGDFIIGDNTNVNNKGVVLFHDGSKLIVQNGGRLIIRKGSKLIMEKNTKLILEPGAKVVVEPGAELIHHENSLLEINSMAKLNIENTAKLTAQPEAQVTINNAGKLIIEDGGLALIQTDIAPGGNTSKNAVLIYNQGAEIQLKGNNAVLELNGRLHIGDNAIFGLTYGGATSGYIKFNRGNTWWNNWATNNAHITCGVNARINLQGQSKTDKLIEISQINVAVPKNLTQLIINKAQIDFNVEGARMESDRSTIISGSTFKSNYTTGSGVRGLLVFGQSQCIISACNFYDTRIEGALFYNNKKLTGVVACNFYNSAVHGWGGGISISGNNFENSAINSVNATLNSSIVNNQMNGVSHSLTNSAIAVSGTNIEFLVKDNKINNYYIGVGAASTNLKLRCNDLQNNNLGLLGSDNVVINMNDNLGGGYNNAANCNEFAYFSEASTFEANNGYNNFQITGGSPCTWIPASGHGPSFTPGKWICPTIMEGSLINFTSQNANTGNYEIFAEQNFWRPLLSANDVIEDRQNKIRKVSYPFGAGNGNPAVYDSASIVTGNFLSSYNQVTCPSGNGGNGETPHKRVHPLDENSSSSTINTSSFYNKKLQKALQLSLTKMDKMQNANKVNQACDLLTECLKFNYVTPVVNSTDKYLLELAYQKLYTCVAQLAEWHRDSAVNFNPMPASLQQRFDDLHAICALRTGRKRITDKDYKEVSDLILLDKAMVYHISDNRQLALNLVSTIIANNPKSEQLPMYEHFRCTWSTELEAINGTISVYEALSQLTTCEKNYKRLPQNNNSSARKVNLTESETVSYANGYAIAVFPNPSTGSLSVSYSLEEFKTVSLEIIDIQGKRVALYNLNPSDKNFSIENLGLQSGMYFYKVTGDDSVLMNKKLVIVK